MDPNSSQNIFSLNASAVEEGDVKERCPHCDAPYSEHTNKMLTRCALAELKGGRKN